MEYKTLIILFLIFCVLITLAVWYNRYEEKKERLLLEQVTTINRGNKAEHQFILQLLKLGVQPHRIFHDLYFKKEDGNYTQIDVAVLCNIGLIVVEIKDYSGWIYGHCQRPEWTKTLNYGKEKHKFYNPIMQNRTHINAIKLQDPIMKRIPIYSGIYFKGDCVIKKVDLLPDSTFVCNDKTFILYQHLFNDTDFKVDPNIENQICTILKMGYFNGANTETVRMHQAYVGSIKLRYT